METVIFVIYNVAIFSFFSQIKEDWFFSVHTLLQTKHKLQKTLAPYNPTGRA